MSQQNEQHLQIFPVIRVKTTINTVMRLFDVFM